MLADAFGLPVAFAPQHDGQRGARLGERQALAGLVEVEDVDAAQADPACPHAIDYSIIAMFEAADLDHRVEKSAWRREAPKLRRALLEAQLALLAQPRFAVVVLIAGVQGAGRGETVNLLHEWMDPRHIETVAFGAPSQEERERPELWRYWNALPPKGKIGVLFDAWHAGPIRRRVRGKTDDDVFAHEI